MIKRFLVALAGCALLAPAAAQADPYADSVVGYTKGTNGGLNENLLPGVVTGAPHGGGVFDGSTDVFSLGLGGTITLGFTDNTIEDGPGADFTVFENAFLVRAGANTGAPFAEPGTVAVSDDGINFVSFPCQLTSGPYFAGCAGVYPAFANADDPGSPPATTPTTTPVQSLVGLPVAGFTPPPGSGGDSFDLSDIGLSRARFVRITGGGQQNFGGTNAGFDLDAVAAVNSGTPPPPKTSIPLYGSSLTATTGAKTQSLSVRAQNLGSEPGYSDQSDPTLDGATLRLQGGDIDQTYDLQRLGWVAKTKKDKLTKVKYKTGEFKYKSPKLSPTAIASVTIGKGKLALSGKGLGLGLDLDPNPVPLKVTLTIGNRVRCAGFGGETKLSVAKNGSRKLTAKKAAAAANCEV